MIKLKVSSLVLDYSLYPRQQIDSHHSGEIREAMRSGIQIPPVKADRKSRRVTDGFHRIRAYLAEYGPDHEIDVIDHPYRSEKAMFEDAMRLNAQHGRNLSSYDRAHCILRAKELGMSDTAIADSLCVTLARVESIVLKKTAIKGNGVSRKKPQSLAIKRTIGHMAGKTLTKKQQTANDRLGGMSQLFYVNQLITLLESDLLDTENEDLMKALVKLRDLLVPLNL